MTKPIAAEMSTPDRPASVTEHIEVDSVPEALDGQRIDRIVALLADVPRSRANTLIAAGNVMVDGELVDRTSVKIAAGSSIAIDFEPVNDALLADPSVEIETVYIDEDVIVVEKQPGLVVHPGSGVTGSTMVNGLLARFPEIAGVGETERPGIVHRLDRGTSGLLMVARNEAALASLSEQLKRRTVERLYRTLVIGHVEADAGVVDAPLGRSPRDAVRRAVVAGGRPARTHYEVVERLGAEESALTLLECRLETGRTHQIRAHLSAIEHPVAGDTTYGGSVDGTALGDALDRPFLHAETLGFDHPITGDRLRFVSPLPSDLAEALATVA